MSKKYVASCSHLHSNKNKQSQERRLPANPLFIRNVSFFFSLIVYAQNFANPFYKYTNDNGSSLFLSHRSSSVEQIQNSKKDYDLLRTHITCEATTVTNKLSLPRCLQIRTEKIPILRTAGYECSVISTAQHFRRS